MPLHPETAENLDRLDRLIARLPQAFVPENAAGVDVTGVLEVHYLDLDNQEQVSCWTLIIKNQTCHTIEGDADQPGLRLICRLADLADVAERQLDPLSAFMQGKFTLKGSFASAMRLPPLFRINLPAGSV